MEFITIYAIKETIMKATEAQEHFTNDVLLSPTSLLCPCSGCVDAMWKHFFDLIPFSF